MVDLSLSKKKNSLSPSFSMYIFKRSSFFVSLSLSLSLSVYIATTPRALFGGVREIEREAYQSVLFEKGTRGLNLFFLSISRSRCEPLAGRFCFVVAVETLNKYLLQNFLFFLEDGKEKTLARRQRRRREKKDNGRNELLVVVRRRPPLLSSFSRQQRRFCNSALEEVEEEERLRVLFEQLFVVVVESSSRKSSGDCSFADDDDDEHRGVGDERGRFVVGRDDYHRIFFFRF